MRRHWLACFFHSNSGHNCPVTVEVCFLFIHDHSLYDYVSLDQNIPPLGHTWDVHSLFPQASKVNNLLRFWEQIDFVFSGLPWNPKGPQLLKGQNIGYLYLHLGILITEPPYPHTHALSYPKIKASHGKGKSSGGGATYISLTQNPRSKRPACLVSQSSPLPHRHPMARVRLSNPKL